MDDNFEKPTAGAPPDATRENAPEEDEQGSDDEEGAQDWAKLAQMYSRAAAPVIPKRGEKEFEPADGGGSGLQKHVLDRARSAMFDVLRTTRVIANKSMSYAIWHPDLARAEVLVAHGVHFAAMGHSAPRPYTDADGARKVYRRLELLPEEALYLVERGALFCAAAGAASGASDTPVPPVPAMPDAPAPPMSVQQAYAAMIGAGGLTLERFQAYAYLKRLGYVVTRADAPDEHYPMPGPRQAVARPAAPKGVLARWWAAVRGCLMPLSWARGLARLWHRVSGYWRPKFDWWHPLTINRWVGRQGGYAHIYRALRFIPAGHDVPLRGVNGGRRAQEGDGRGAAEEGDGRGAGENAHPREPAAEPPYRVFFNVYKPMTAFKKSSPPPPDYQVVVVDARTTHMPSLAEFAALFAQLPERPPPLPRKKNVVGAPLAPGEKVNRALPNAPRRARPAMEGVGVAGQGQGQGRSDAPGRERPVTEPSFLARLFPWAFPSPPPPPPPAPSPPRINPFMALRAGRRMVVVAAVDSGNVSFYRFMQGAFGEWAMW